MKDAFACEVQRAGLPIIIREFHMVFLRHGLPCDLKCTDLNNTLRASLQICAGCDATGHLLNRSEQIRAWHKLLTNSTYAIITGAGAWYNVYKGLNDAPVAYNETLTLLIPLLQRAARRGTKVIWVGLPPEFDDNRHPQFGYASFKTYDVAARFLISNVPGAVFLNLSAATSERKFEDPSLSVDGLHWCNFGEHGVPQFVAERLLYLLSR
jgi:hypothetical protein